MFGTAGIAVKLGIAAVIAAILVGAGFWGCYHFEYIPEHDAYTKFVAQTAQIGKDQAAQVKLIDAQHAKELNDANQNTVDTATAIADYWKSHPVVRVRYTSSGCSAVPEATGHTQSANGAATGDYASAYLSEYSPESTEQVANRLYRLQKLLIKYGVTVQ